MIDRLLAGGLRVQLALAISLVTVLGVGVSFVVLYGQTGSKLRAGIDANLHTQAAEWRQFRAHANLATPAELERLARRFIADQRYHAASLIFAVQASGGGTVSNEGPLIAREQTRERERRDLTGLLNTPAGLTTTTAAEAGSVRVLSEPVLKGGREIGTIRIAAPLRPVEQAQASMRSTFLPIGLLIVLLAAAAGLGLASVIAAPLRRMARVAAAVEAGDMSMRAGHVRGRGEAHVLAEAFDRMLARLDRAFKRQRDFVSDASHELRTPLAVLRAQVELLQAETDESRRRESTRSLLRRLDELDRLVGDMLTLASAESGQLVQPRAIDLAELFEDLRRDLPLFGDRDFRLAPVTGTLHADPDRLTQTLRNLIRNAVAHTRPSDRVEIAARTHGQTLEITVSDTGPGIAADQLGHIFERFYRVDSSRSRDSGGSGLGLAIARAIVEAHGGRIYADSTLGQGARFHIELPGYQPSRHQLHRPDEDRQPR